MAKTRGPLYSLTASASFADVISFLRIGSRTLAQRYSFPGSKRPAPPTAPQVIQRAKFAAAKSEWAAFSPAEKATYAPSTNADAHLSPWNLFLRERLSVPLVPTSAWTTPAGQPWTTKAGTYWQ